MAEFEPIELPRSSEIIEDNPSLIAGPRDLRPKRNIPTFGEAAVANFRREWVPHQLAKAMKSAPAFPPGPPGYSAVRALEERRADVPDAVFNFALDQDFDRFALIKSDDELDYYIEQITPEVEQFETAMMGGIGPAILGGIGAAILSPDTYLGGFAVGSAYRTWRAAQFAQKGFASRLSSSVSLGALSMGEQSARETALQFTDPTRTWWESTMAVGLAGPLGGIFGAAMPPKRLGLRPPRTAEELDDHLMNPDTDIGPPVSVPADPEAQRELFDSLSAARSRDNDTVSKKRRSLGFLDRFTPEGRAFRRAKRLQAMGEDALAAEQFDLFARITDVHTNTANVDRGFAQIQSSESWKKHFEQEFVNVQAGIADIWREMRKEIWSKNPNILATDVMTSGKGTFARYQSELRKFWISRETGEDYVPDPDMLVGLTPDQVDRFKTFIKRGVEAEDDYYRRMQETLVANGLLKQEDVIANYRPQIYNREAIAANPQAAKVLIYRRLVSDPDPKWLDQNYNVRSVDDLDPAVQEEVLDEWRVFNREGAQRLADDAYDALVRQLNSEAGLVKSLKKLSSSAKAKVAARTVKAARRNARKAAEVAEARRSQVDKLETEQAELDATFRQAEAEMQRVSIKDGSQVPFIAKDFDLGKITGRLAEIRKGLTKARGRLARAEERKMLWEGKSTEAEAQLANAKALSDFARRNVRKRSAKLQKLQKKVKAQERKISELESQTEPGRAAEEIVNRILDRKNNPLSVLPDSVILKSSRLKQRTLDWGDMLHRSDVQNLLRNDPFANMAQYARSIGAEIGIKQNFEGGQEGFKQAVRDAQDSLRKRAARLEAAGKTKEASRIAQMASELGDDMDVQLNRLFDRARPPRDPNSFVMWAGNQAKSFNFLTSMGSVLLSSITDPATASAALRSHGAAMLPLMQSASRTLRRAADAGLTKDQVRELKALLVGITNSTMHSRAHKLSSLDEPTITNQGFGVGTTRAVSAQVEDVLDKGTAAMSHGNFMNVYNTRNRIIWGTNFMSNMARHVRQGWKSLDEGVQRMYLGAGLDEADFARIKSLYDQHSVKVDDGIVMPKLDEWMKTDPQTAMKFRLAFTKVMDKAQIIPGQGDLPNMMDNLAGQLLFQFQAFGFSSLNRYTRPMVSEADAFAAWNATMAIALGGLAYVIRQAVKGQLGQVEENIEDFQNQGDTTLLYEAFTRSPLIGPAAIPLDMLVRIVGGTMNDHTEKMTGLRPVPGTSRLAERNAWTLLLGPTFGLGERAFGALGEVLKNVSPEASAEDRLRLQRKLIRTAPFNNLFWLQGAANIAGGESSPFKPRPENN